LDGATAKISGTLLENGTTNINGSSPPLPSRSPLAGELGCFVPIVNTKRTLPGGHA
jgi:hypothetical protein